MHGFSLTPSRTLSALIAASLLLVAAPAAHATPDEGEVRASMVSLFASLRYVLIATSTAHDGDKALDPAVLKEINHIRNNAHLVERHFAAQDSDATFFARRVRRTAASLQHYYGKQDHDRVRHVVHNLVDSCMFCHVRLPDRTDSLMSRGFLQNDDLQKLPLPARARALAATRQFDASSQAWEQAFAQMPAKPFPDYREDLVDYLTVRVRVKEDTARPAETLEQLAGKKGLHKEDKALLTQWATALRQAHNPGLASRTDLERCEAHALAAETHRDAPADERALIYSILASASCYMAASPRAPAAQRAQAYFYLAESEKQILGARDPGRIEDRLEHAIRLAPHSDIADRSYHTLEEWVVAQNTGSSGTHMPGDVRERLRALEKLAQPKR